MADYYANARSNLFEVKDINAFEKKIEVIDGIELLREGNGVCLLFEEGIIDEYYSEETDSFIKVDWKTIFKKHLKEYQVAVFIESGAEKLRYIVGVAVAYSWTGEAVWVNLDNIYGLAQEEFGGDAIIDRAEY